MEAIPFNKVIVIGYYDGPIEGFGSRPDGCFYFRVIAWDAGQDLRLFALWQTSDDALALLEDRLKGGGESSRYPIWVPKWTFKSDEFQQEADDLVDSLRSGLKLKEFLLGEGIGSELRSVVQFSEALEKRANTVASEGDIGSVDDWLSELSFDD